MECQFKQDTARTVAPGIASALQSTCFVCTARTVGRRMQRLRLRLSVRYAKKCRRTADSNHTDVVAPNHLDRAFIVSVPNRVWVSDTPA